MLTETTKTARPPVYFERLIDAWYQGFSSRHAHLGHWDLQDDGTPLPAQLTVEHPLTQAQIRLNERMINLASIQNGISILDVACGFGGLIQQLNQTFADIDLTGANIDVRQLEICQQLTPVNGNALRWQEADACDLPFSRAAFDVVFCIEAMFHFASRQRFLKEAWRVLKPGGRLVVTDLVLKRQPQLPQFCFEAVLCDGYGPWPDPWCDRGHTVELLQATGEWEQIFRQDATLNTLPSYQFIVSRQFPENRDPGDVAARSAMLLKWLHTNGLLRYEYVTAVAGAPS